MITMELISDYLKESGTKILSTNNSWIRDYRVVDISSRFIFEYDEWIVMCEYEDCDVIKIAPISIKKDNLIIWLMNKREEKIDMLLL